MKSNHTLWYFLSAASDGVAKDEDEAKAVSKKVNRKKKKKKRDAVNGGEAGEDTDEGDMESREVDYMSDSSSNSELEFLVSDPSPEFR
jgi:hypothetical protein